MITLKTREFVQAVKVMGGTRRRIVLRHLVPNAIGVIVVNDTFTLSDAILTLSALSFLGLGLPQPQADWGGMLSGGLNYLFDGYWWLVYPPAAILILTVVAFNLGEGLEPWSVRWLLMAGDPRPTHGVDVTGEPLERGIASLEAHAQYLAGIPGHPPPRLMITGITAMQGRAMGVPNAGAVQGVGLPRPAADRA